MASTSVGSVAMDLTLNNKNYNKQLNAMTKSTEGAFSSSMKKVGSFIAGAFAIKQVVDFTKTCIDSASKVQSAFTGLNSIVQGTGNSFAEAKDFINQYTADGLVSIQETATAYKNLLSRGYDTSQIEDVLTRLKDSAAFGRQASYDLGEAVVSASEGLKNENSILVDNAGVTKNVAKMWDEYAKSIGTTANDLTQQQKIQAEYNGIMKETQFQVGDAAAYTKTFSGQVQQLKFNFTQMTAAIGKVVAPIAQLFIPILNSAMQAVTNLFEKLQVILKSFGLEMPDVVSKASDVMGGISSDIENTGDSAVDAAKKINKAFAGVDEINVLNTKSSDSGGTSSVQTPGGSSEIESEGKDAVSIVDKIRDKLSDLWNTDFVQSFTGAVESSFNFLKDFAITIGGDIGRNFANTWKNIEGNLKISVSNISYLWTSFWNSFSTTVNTWGPTITSSFSNLFNTIYTTAIGPFIELATQVWTDFTSSLVSIWDEYGPTLLDNLGNFVNTNIELWNSLYDNIIEPIITPALETLSWLWDEHLKYLVEDVGEFIMKLYNGALEIYNKFIAPIVSFLLDILEPAWTTVSSFIVSTFGTAIATISDLISGLLGIFGGIIDFISGVFTGNWEKAWNGVKDIFKGIVDSLTAIFRAPINLIIDGINAFIKGLNKIKIPDWVPAVGGKGINIPTIPKLAQGGYFPTNQPQLAIVGDNTREPEIVAPESKIYDQVRNAIRDSGGTGKQEIEITIYHKYEDGRTIIQKINQAQIDEGQVLVLS